MNNNKYSELATSWYPDALIGLAAIVIFFVGNFIFYVIAMQMITSKVLLFFSSQIFSIIVLISLFNLQKKRFHPTMRLKGEFNWHDYRVFLLVFIAISFISLLFSRIFNIPDEINIIDMLGIKTSIDLFIICLSVTILAPVLEKLLFRHFILAIFSYNLGGKWAAYAIVFSALVFSLVHTQYTHTITGISIFLIGGVLALSRIISKGLLLPILLHASFVNIEITVNSKKIVAINHLSLQKEADSIGVVQYSSNIIWYVVVSLSTSIMFYLLMRPRRDEQSLILMSICLLIGVNLLFLGRLLFKYYYSTKRQKGLKRYYNQENVFVD